MLNSVRLVIKAVKYDIDHESYDTAAQMRLIESISANLSQVLSDLDGLQAAREESLKEAQELIRRVNSGQPIDQ